MKNNQYYSSSKRRTPWDGQDELSPTQLFIKSKYLGDYSARHIKISETDEAEFLNTFEIKECKHCDSVHFKKIGFTKAGIQRYKCLNCNRTFNILTNTIFDNHKIPIGEWINYLLNIFGYVSFNSTSRNSKTSKTTTKYWLIKLFAILENYQENTVLKNKVWIDETFVRDIQKVMDDKDLFQGEKHFCIGIGYDKHNVYLKVEGRSTSTNRKWTYSAFINHIEKGSTIIHDKERSHDVLVEPLNLISKAYDANKCKKMPDDKNPLTPINDICYLLKQFLRAHQGFDRDQLQDYLNLFAFMMNEPHDKLEKIEYLINCAVYSANSIKYRDEFSNKCHE